MNFGKLDTATLLRAATVVWNRRHICNRGNADTERAQSANRRFASGTWAFNFDIKILDTLFNGGATSNFRSNLGSKGSRFTRTLEALATR